MSASPISSSGLSAALLRLLRHPLALAVLAVLVIAPGIWLPTGLTGKDEYFLGLRTPMEMMAGDHWLLPFLDQAPRIKKPPLLYWLGRASYEVFGVSLASARIVTVLFAALLVASTAGIARRILQSADSGIVAALILLGCLGLHSEGRRFMLDVPVAALSTAAFWSFLVWLDQKRWPQLSLCAVLLAAGFLVKGPVVALVFGGGLLALIAMRHDSLRDLRRHLPALGSNAVLAAALALPWFIWVRLAAPEAAEVAFADEMESRRFFELSPGFFLGLLNIALPWFFVFIATAWAARKHPASRLLLLWFALTFLPFALIKSFDRYLIGSLVPLAILLAQMLPAVQVRWPWRLGMIAALLFGGGLATLAMRFGLGGWGWWLPAAVYLAWSWWTEHAIVHRLIAPVLYGMALLWGLFPALQVNAIPEQVIALGRTRPVAMFGGPQPALLPILSQHTQRHYTRLGADDLNALAESRAVLFAEEEDLPALQGLLAAHGYRNTPAGEYQVLASHGSGLRFARPGTRWADWRQAWHQASPAPLMTRIAWFEVERQ